MILEAKGQPQKSVEAYRRALQIHPNWPLAQRRLADALAITQQTSEAITEYERLLTIVPGEIQARLRLAELLGESGKNREAETQYREALRLSPDDPNALNNLAWLLSTAPQEEIRDGAEAVRFAERACELTQRKNPLLIGTLAAAYAENEQFDEGVRAADEAVKLAREQGFVDLASTNERLRGLYRQRKPFRQGADLQN
jgi:Flp pilus assembly protein TadD